MENPSVENPPSPKIYVYIIYLATNGTNAETVLRRTDTRPLIMEDHHSEALIRCRVRRKRLVLLQVRVSKCPISNTVRKPWANSVTYSPFPVEGLWRIPWRVMFFPED